MAARCARHGLAIAPDGRCVRCRREEEEAADPSLASKPGEAGRRRAALAALLVASVGIGAALVMFRASRSAPAAAASTASAPRAQRATEEAPPLAPLESAKLPAEAPTAANAASSRDDRLRNAMHRVPITVYGTAESNDAKRARAWLFANGYVFTDRDVANDPSAERARRALVNADVVPVLDIEGQPITGFDPDRVTRALEYAAARHLQR